jgi:hypothetical protein
MSLVHLLDDAQHFCGVHHHSGVGVMGNSTCGSTLHNLGY